jgi:membrane protease YdiL (CAAX protease family)
VIQELIQNLLGTFCFLLIVIAVVRKYLTDTHWFIERFEFRVEKAAIIKEIKLIPFLVLFSAGAHLFIEHQYNRVFPYVSNANIFSQVDPFPLHSPDFLPFFFFVVLLGPLLEELGFRGFALQIFDRWKGILAAILINSFVFGLLHGFNFLGAAITGMVCSVLFYKTGNLLYSILIHGLYNLCVYAFGLLYSIIHVVSPSIDVNSVQEKPLLVSFIFIAISAFPLYEYFSKDFVSVLQAREEEVFEEFNSRADLDEKKNDDEIFT